MLKVLETQLATLLNNAKTTKAEIDAKGDTAAREDWDKLAKIIEEGKAVRKKIDDLKAVDDLAEHGDAPTPRAIEQREKGRKSMGQQVIESDAFKNNNGLELRPITVKSTLLTTSVTGGNFAQPMRVGEIVDKPIRPLSLLNFIGQGNTSSNSIEFVQQTSYTNNAAPQTEGAAKAETDMAFSLLTVPVLTIAHWIAASRQVLSDAPMLQGLVDNQLLQLLYVKLEDQVTNGSGTGGNMRGILNTSGIQLRTQSATTPVGRGQTTADKVGDTIRRAITDIQLAFYDADLIMMNPADLESMELEKDTQGRYLNYYDPIAARVWRVPVAPANVLAAKTSLVGNFGLGATLWMREDAIVRASENVNDDFIKNVLRLLAEVRAGLTVHRPDAFEKVTLA